MKPIRVTMAAGASVVTQAIPLDINQDPFNVTVVADLVSTTSVAGMTVQVTVNDVFAAGFVSANAKWFSAPDTNVVNKTADMIGTINQPVTACRLIAAASDGNVEFTVIQAVNTP